MKLFDVVFNTICKCIEIIMIIVFALLVMDVLWQVCSRYVFNTAFSWTEEFARFSLIWLSILGAAYLTAKQEHLSMDFIYRKLSESNKKKVTILIDVLVFLFAFIVMGIGGSNLVYTTLHLEQVSGTLRIPLGYIYAILPCSGFLIMFFSLYHLLKTNSNHQIIE